MALPRQLPVCTTFLVLSLCGGAFGQENVCKDAPAQTQPQIDAITKKYNEKLASQGEGIKARAAEIEQDAKKSKPSNVVEGAIKFKIDISSHIETIKLDLPTVAIHDQDLSFDLPEVSMKQQTWKYDIPQTKMDLKCIPGLPETVCHMETKDFGLFKTDIPVCSTRPGKEICTLISVVFMAPTQTILGVPEVVMRTQKIRMGIPEFKMETQEIKFSVPDFTVRNIEADMKKTKKDTEDLSASAQDGANAVSAAMRTEIAKVSSATVSATLDCQKSALNTQRAQALSEIDKAISVVQAALHQAQAVGAAALATTMQTSLTQLVDSRKKASAPRH